MKTPTLLCLIAMAVLTCGAAAPAPPPLALANRISWGATGTEGDPSAYLEAQLHPGADDGLPPAVQQVIDNFDISRKSLVEINRELVSAGQDSLKQKDAPNFADIARQIHQRYVSLENEAVQRSLLRDIYSRNQLKEQLTWFWFNHFNIFQRKRHISFMMGDYEETAIRKHVLGHFRDLVAATLFHPAMIEYLDNQQNQVGHINENYARELMELHTMGVGGGYTQKDVQELARILTGVGVNGRDRMPKMPPQLRDQYRTDGFFEFNPARHDYGDKVLLGQTIKGTGLAEVSEAITLLTRQPATAHFISTKLAQYFCCDTPPESLVGAMARTFRKTDGDIAAVLRTLFDSPEFAASLGTKFKDPMHYAVSAMRAAYAGQDGPAIVNVDPLIHWIGAMAEPLYSHDTPDGYAMTDAAWSGPGAMTTRFDVARQIGMGNARLFVPSDQAAGTPPVGPPLSLQTSPYATHVLPALGGNTARALGQARKPGDWNMLFLSSPEFMRR